MVFQGCWMLINQPTTAISGLGPSTLARDHAHPWQAHAWKHISNVITVEHHAVKPCLVSYICKLDRLCLRYYEIVWVHAIRFWHDRSRSPQRVEIAAHTEQLKPAGRSQRSTAVMTSSHRHSLYPPPRPPYLSSSLQTSCWEDNTLMDTGKEYSKANKACHTTYLRSPEHDWQADMVPWNAVECVHTQTLMIH